MGLLTPPGGIRLTIRVPEHGIAYLTRQKCVLVSEDVVAARDMRWMVGPWRYRKVVVLPKSI